MVFRHLHPIIVSLLALAAVASSPVYAVGPDLVPVTVTDDFSDWSMVSDKTANWGIDSSNPDNFDGDTTRAFRETDTAESLTYRIENVRQFVVTVYTLHCSGWSVTFYSSRDNGVSWVPVEVVYGNRTYTLGEWGYFTVKPAAALPPGTDAVKVVVGSTGLSWDPQIAGVTLSALMRPAAATLLGQRTSVRKYRLQARKLYDAGDRSGAIESYRKAFQIEASYSLADCVTDGQAIATGMQNDQKFVVDLYTGLIKLAHSMRSGSEQEARALVLRGDTYKVMPAWEDAHSDYVEAASLFHKLKMPSDEAHALVMLGWTNLYLEHDAAALTTENDALQIYRRVGSASGQADALLAMGWTEENSHLADEKHRQLAITDGSRAVELYRKDNNLWAEAEALDLVGAANANDNSQTSQTYYLQARDLFERIGDTLLCAHENMKIASAYIDQHKYEAAIEPLEEAIPTILQAHDPQQAEWAFTYMGQAYAGLKQNNKALSYYAQAMAVLPASQNKTVVYLYEYITDLWIARGNPNMAIIYGKLAVNEMQKYRSVNGLGQEFDTKYIKENEDRYRQLASLLVDAGRLPEAQQVLDLLKDQEYSHYLRRSGVVSDKAGVMLSTTPREQECIDRLQADGARITEAGSKMAELQAVKNKLKHDGHLSDWTPSQEAELQAEQDVVAKANAEYEKTVADLTATFTGKTGPDTVVIDSCRSLQSTLAALNRKCPGTVALCTLTADQAVYVLIVTPEVIVSTNTPIDQIKLNNLIADFRTSLQDPTKDPRPAGKALYDVVFNPLESELSAYHAHTLMWSLDGALRYVPIAALYDGKSYVAENYAIEQFTTASRDTMREAPQSQWSALAVGVSKAHGKFPALTSVPAELRSVVHEGDTAGGVLPGSILLDSQFTRKAFADALAENMGDSPQYPVIHIASHFDLDPAKADDSALLLGDGTQMKVSDLATMAQGFENADLVTLSACDTAVASGDNGAEVDGLGMLAQKRGAKSVIATLWSVYDSSTCQFMADFYRERQTGLSKADALRQAQLSLLHGTGASASTAATAGGPSNRGVERNDQASSPEPTFKADPAAPYAHPYYWAPFVLIGNWM